MIKSENGTTKIVVITLTVVTLLIILIICQIIGFIKSANENGENVIIEKFTDPSYENIIVSETKKSNEIITAVTEELEFTQEYLQSGKTSGNVEIQYNEFEKLIVLSITGNSKNTIQETDSIKGKNRWYKNINLSNYSSFEFYARKGKDNGDVMIFIDDNIIKRIRYTDLSTTWAKYKIDISNYKGEHTLSIAGGYADSTGSEESNTQYCNIKLK